MERDNEEKAQRSEIRGDALFNLFVSEWELLSNEEQATLMDDIIDIFQKYQN